MIENESGSSQGIGVLRDVIDQIETLRITRQEQVREHPHPLLKRFTQQELTDEACPTYKNLLVGRSQRIPSRHSLTQIADYLECMAIQRNDLLLAARYLPDNLELNGLHLKQAVEQAEQVMATLPYPAMIVTHTLEIAAFNESFQRLFEVPPLTTIPQAQRHFLQFIFRHDMPIRGRSTFNDQAVKAWEAGVSRGIQLFKQSNRLYQFEQWYRELVEQFCAVTDFRRYWEQSAERAVQHSAPAKLLLTRNAITGRLLPIQMRFIRISVCSHVFPCIMALLPLDDAARDVIASLGAAGEYAASGANIH